MMIQVVPQSTTTTTATGNEMWKSPLNGEKALTSKSKVGRSPLNVKGKLFNQTQIIKSLA